jgi:predicted 3-demethylubiquinone-9 3-methyltransferase (glyoxalase superfamily)
MCTFTVKVEPKSVEEKAQAMSRMRGMLHVTSIKEVGRSVVAVVDHPKPLNQAAAAGWAKDSFGIHPTMTPGVSMVT